MCVCVCVCVSDMTLARQAIISSSVRITMALRDTVIMNEVLKLEILAHIQIWSDGVKPKKVSRYVVSVEML